MKKRTVVWIIILGALLIIAAFLFWHFSKRSIVAIASPTPSPVDRGIATNAVPTPPPSAVSATPSDQSEQRDMIIKAYETPINFWGKVIDEKGNPVPGAEVQLMAIDKPMSDKGTHYDGKSDVNGLFSITGSKGAGLYVQVFKEGYYQTEQSGYIIGYGILNDHKAPSPSDPSIFVLRKMGQTEPLKVYSSGGIRVPKDGQSVEVSLSKGCTVSSGQGDIRVEVWTQDQQKDAQGHYPWRCQVSVPGGGLIERKGDYNFVAPESGYKPVVEISMDQTATRWQDDIESQFFVKLKDGSFARLKFRLITGGDHFFMIKSYLNPIVGSRNLEFDPNKTVNTEH